MKTIWKYQLETTGTQYFEMPLMANVIHVSEQDGTLMLWATVEEDAPRELRTFYVRGTGQPLTGEEHIHLGTVVTNGGQLVWHVFE
jgi:hypothetical protein